MRSELERTPEGANLNDPLVITLRDARQRSKRKTKAEAENNILDKSRCSQFTANARFHSDEDNKAAHRRCRQLIDSGVAAVDWVELYGQKM